MAGKVCWAGMAQPADPTDRFSPVDMGAISGFAQRPPPTVHELRALALSTRKHVHGDPLPPANPPAQQSWLGAQSALTNEEQNGTNRLCKMCVFLSSNHVTRTCRSLIPARGESC